MIFSQDYRLAYRDNNGDNNNTAANAAAVTAAVDDTAVQHMPIFDRILFQHDISVELRHIIKLNHSIALMDGDTLRKAIHEWKTNTTMASLKYGLIEDWDTSHITDMNHAFEDYPTFNSMINNWDVSNVTTMKYTFHRANRFNQPLDQSMECK